MSSGGEGPAARGLPEGKGISRMAGILWIVLVVLIVLWLLGLAFHVAGGLIHLLLVIAVIVILYRLITGRRPVA